MQTGTQYFTDRSNPSPRKPMFRYRQAGKWVRISATRFYGDIGRTITLLEQAGLKKGNRLVMILPTGYPFVLLDWACRAMGVVSVPIHPSSSDEERKQVIKETTPTLIVSASGASAIELLAEDVGVSVPVWAVDDPVMKRDRLDVRIADLAEASWSLEAPPEQLVTLVYTSGTTGKVRGVKVTARMIEAMEQGAIRALTVSHQDRMYLFLPASHIFGRLFLWIQGRVGYEIALAPDYSRIQLDLAEVQPTVLGVVPRLLEKLYEQMVLRMKGQAGPGELVWNLAVRTAVQRGRHERVAFPAVTAVTRRILDQIVYRKIRQIFGGQVRYVISGGAPLAPDLSAFFSGTGVTVLQGYGLTETTGVVFLNRPGERAYNSVGRAIDGVEFKLGEENEILLRGPMVFDGYWKHRTKVRDQDGWFHTGDVGKVDAAGQLRIVGRCKDIIVTANGKNISPIKIERKIDASSLIDKTIVIGDNRPYLVALLAVNREAIMRKLGQEHIPDFASDREVRTLVEREIERVNKRLGSFETIKYFRIVHGAFTTAGGELTSTMKPKRNVIEEKFADLIADMYPASYAREL